LQRIWRREAMQMEDRGDQSLATFFEDAIKGSEEEVKSIIEIQKIVEEIISLEERPQIYQLKATSNW
jgi:hypothetical protein